MGGLLSYFYREENNSEIIASPPQQQYQTNTPIITQSGVGEHNRRKLQDECNLTKPEQKYVYPRENRYSSKINTDLYVHSLSPSVIHYTQDTIATTFYEMGRHGGVKLGETLDELLCDKISIKDIPRITVFQSKQQWFSLDNRRLWVLKNYEKIKGKIQIIVRVTTIIDEDKLTTKNNGKSINVRGDPGGIYWKAFRNMYH